MLLKRSFAIHQQLKCQSKGPLQIVAAKICTTSNDLVNSQGRICAEKQSSSFVPLPPSGSPSCTLTRWNSEAHLVSVTCCNWFSVWCMYQWAFGRGSLHRHVWIGYKGWDRLVVPGSWMIVEVLAGPWISGRKPLLVGRVYLLFSQAVKNTLRLSSCVSISECVCLWSSSISVTSSDLVVLRCGSHCAFYYHL